MRILATKVSVGVLSAMLPWYAPGQPCHPYWVRVLPHGLEGVAHDLQVWDAGGTPVLFVGGGFRRAGTFGAWPFGTWNGRDWSFATNGLVLPATSDEGHLWTLGDGTDGVLYSFSVQQVAPFAGQRKKWASPGWVDADPAFYSPAGFPVLAYPGGAGLVIYGIIPEVLPQLNVAGGWVAKWTGTKWEALGSPPYPSAHRETLVMFDDGTGLALHAASSNGPWAAKWDGANWVSLGLPPGTGGIRRFCVYDSGSGPELYAGGPCGGIPGAVIRWNGKEWRDVGGGLAPVGFGVCGVSDMDVFDDGSGPALFVTGTFDLAGGMPTRGIAKWDGQQWSPLGAGLTVGGGTELAVYDDGRGLSLFVGGYDNLKAGAGVTPVLAQWVGCIGQCYPDCNNDHVLTVADFGCFQTKYVTLDPYADCNVDGAFTVGDFGCFQSKFVAGCP